MNGNPAQTSHRIYSSETSDHRVYLRSSHGQALNARWLIWRQRTFDLGLLRNAIEANNPDPLKLEKFTAVNFDLSNKLFYDLFGVEVEPTLYLNTNTAAASTLLKLPVLQKVYLSFQAFKSGAQCNPLGWLGAEAQFGSI